MRRSRLVVGDLKALYIYFVDPGKWKNYGGHETTVDADADIHITEWNDVNAIRLFLDDIIEVCEEIGGRTSPHSLAAAAVENGWALEHNDRPSLFYRFFPLEGKERTRKWHCNVDICADCTILGLEFHFEGPIVDKVHLSRIRSLSDGGLPSS